MERWIDRITNCSSYKESLGNMFPEHTCSPLPTIVWSLLISLEVIYPLHEVNHGYYCSYQANDLVSPSELDILLNTRGREGLRCSVSVQISTTGKGKRSS